MTQLFSFKAEHHRSHPRHARRMSGIHDFIKDDRFKVVDGRDELGMMAVAINMVPPKSEVLYLLYVREARAMRG